MSQAGRFTPEVVPGTYIEQINGDSGSVSGAIVSFNATPVSGSSVSFDGFGTTMLFNVTDSNVNTIVGNAAGNNSISGIQNTSLGAVALAALTTGSQNVMMGVGAGDQLLTGSYNIGIGFDAADSYTGSESSNIMLNNGGTIGESHTLRIGEGTGTGNGQLNRAFIAGIEGITVATADQVLVINSSDQIGSVTVGTSGQILTSAGAGANPVWANNTAISTIDGNSGSATGATVGIKVNQTVMQSYTDSSTVNFYASGSDNELSFTDNLNNTGVGYLSLSSLVGNGGSNTAFGFSCLLAVNAGDNNTAIGAAAGQVVGQGQSNTLVGYSTGMAVTDGEANTLIGVAAANRLVTGNYNIIIGAATDGDLPFTSAAGYNYTSNESSNIIIGNLGVTGEDNVIRIGTSGSASGEQNKCYIAGIGGVDVGSVANMVVEDNDQLGTAVLAAGTNISISAGPNIITVSGDPAVIMNYVTVNNAASPYTVLADDNYISADVTAGTVTIRLPNAPTIGRVFTVKDKVGLAATNNITVTTVGGTVTIDGATSFVMNTAYESISVIFNGLTYEVW